MPRPIFGVTAACRLDITTGSSSRAAYFALVAQYHFGTPVIFDRAPEELAATIGVPFFSAVGDPGLVASIPGVVVVSFPYPTPSVVIAGTPYPVSTAANGGTIVGANYVDGNGVLWPDVDWRWNISVEAYQNSAVGSGGTFDVQVVTWVGDGTSNRLIPTTFPLNTGVVAIWGCGGADNTGSFETNFFRHNVTSMQGTALAGLTQDPQTAAGIMGFAAPGFLVTAGVTSFTFANTAGVNYTAIVLRDTTTDNRYLRVGTYMGFGGGSINGTVVHGSSGITGSSYSPYMNGLQVHDSSGTYAFTYLSSTTGQLSPVYAGVNGTASLTIDIGVGDRTILATSQVGGGSPQLTHLWIWGSSLGYKSVDVPGLYSATLLSGASGGVPIQTMIKNLGLAQFTIDQTGAGSNFSVNAFRVLYDYLALATDAALLAAHVFASATGVAAGGTTNIPFPFAPGIAFARQGNLAGYTSGGWWRSTQDSSTLSTAVAITGAGNHSFTGITALNGASIDVSALISIAGQPYYAWAWLGGSVTVPAPPVYTPVPVPPQPAPPGGGPVPPGIPPVPPDATQICQIGTAITPSV